MAARHNPLNSLRAVPAQSASLWEKLQQSISGRHAPAPISRIEPQRTVYRVPRTAYRFDLATAFMITIA